MTEIDFACSQVLLDRDPNAATTAALEDWGFDEQAEWAWRGLSLRDRRAAKRRTELLDDPGPAGVLLRARDGLVRDVDEGLELFHAPPAPGVDLEVHDARTRHGRISCALRWHGEHPALLWEIADGERAVELRVPQLAPGWFSRDPAGEALLRATPA